MSNDPYCGFPPTIAARLLEILRHSGWSLSVQWQSTVCKVRLADGRMLLLNYDIDRNRVWLAGGESGSEYVYRDGRWISVHGGSELYADAATLLEHLVKSSPHSMQKGQVSDISGQLARQAVAVPVASRPRWPYLLLPMAALIGYFLLRPETHVSAVQVPPAGLPVPVAEQRVDACETRTPASGSQWLADGLQADPGQASRVSLSNNHGHDMVVFLTRPSSAEPVQSVFLPSRSQAQMQVTPGDYELMFSLGTDWCSLQAGYKDGKISKLSQRLGLKPQQGMAIELQSTGAQATEFAVLFRNETPSEPVVPPPVAILGNGEMRLQMAQDGHYYLQGAINGRPVDFLVDTGASFTTLKQDLAVAGGIRDCRATQSKTANGIVDVCIGLIPEIRIGAYIIQNAVVVANPKTEANLLGMNVLGQFRIRTENGAMYLSRP